MKLGRSLWFTGLTLAIAACGGKDDDDGNDHHEPAHIGQQFGPQASQPDPWQGDTAINGNGSLQLGANLQGAIGLMSMESEGASLVGNGLETALYKIKSDGTVASVLEYVEENQDDWPSYQNDIPPVKSMAISPTGEVYVHFEWTIWFDDEECNLFRIGNSTAAELIAAGNTADLHCIAPGLWVENWDLTRDSVFQFDKNGNIYFPAYDYEKGGQELIRLSPDGSQKVMINSNIWFQDFFVTGNGGVFYVGQSQTGGDGGFFRYITPSGSLQQIASDWWNFHFEPIVGDTGDKALFYGPDPLADDNNNAWETACLFEYDPSAFDLSLENPKQNAIEPVVTCGGNLYTWLYLANDEDEAVYGNGPRSNDYEAYPSQAWIDEFTNRCTSSGQTFAGGGDISKIHQNSAGEIFVIGTINTKITGVNRCTVSAYGQHCTDASGDLVDATTSGDCTAAGGTWTDSGGYCSGAVGGDQASCVGSGGTWHFSSDWFSDQTGAVCTHATSGNHSTTTADAYHALESSSHSCETEAGGWDWELLTDYKGLAKVDRENKTLVPLMQDQTEEAIRFWFVNDEAYFLAKKSGVFRLRKYVEGQSPELLLSNFEVYHLAASGHAGVLLFNGLDFNTNEFVFGEFDVSTAELEENNEVKGKVSSLVIFE